MLSIDLFAGCGGLTSGLSIAGFECIWANEFDQQAAKTFEQNFEKSEVCTEDIRLLKPREIREKLCLSRGQLDLVAGGFPCQGFSTYGQRRPDDIRNRLYIQFLDFVSEFRPQMVLIENVVGILSMLGGEVVSDICQKLDELGYQTTVDTLQAADYGVPQFRKRVFIVGTRGNAIYSTPAETNQPERTEALKNTTLTPYVTVRDAIRDLPKNALKPSQAHETIKYPRAQILSSYAKEMRKKSDSVLHHSAKQLLSIRKLRVILMQQGDYGRSLNELDPSKVVPSKIIKEIVEDCGLRRPLEKCRIQDREKEAELRAIISRKTVYFRDLIDLIGSGGFANKYRRLRFDAPSHTLVAHMARDCSDFIHPIENRFISVREAARLQSFADEFSFAGSQFAQLKQIGNAVPPLLAKAVGQSLRSGHLNSTGHNSFASVE